MLDDITLTKKSQDFSEVILRYVQEVVTLLYSISIYKWVTTSWTYSSITKSEFLESSKCFMVYGIDPVSDQDP